MLTLRTWLTEDLTLLRRCSKTPRVPEHFFVKSSAPFAQPENTVFVEKQPGRPEVGAKRTMDRTNPFVRLARLPGC